MPIKKRTSKRKAWPVPPSAWDLLFECGHDYFRDLDALDLAETEMLAAAREAWARHGTDFLRAWEPQPGRAVPWAAEVFGMPNGETDTCR